MEDEAAEEVSILDTDSEVPIPGCISLPNGACQIAAAEGIETGEVVAQVVAQTHSREEEGCCRQETPETAAQIPVLVVVGLPILLVVEEVLAMEAAVVLVFAADIRTAEDCMDSSPRLTRTSTYPTP